MSTPEPPGAPPPDPDGRENSQSGPERYFPAIVKYSGLLLAMYQGLIERPPQSLVIGLAALMMAGSEAIRRIMERRG